jgi:hypothetical protein
LLPYDRVTKDRFGSFATESAGRPMSAIPPIATAACDAKNPCDEHQSFVTQAVDLFIDIFHLIQNLEKNLVSMR